MNHMKKQIGYKRSIVVNRETVRVFARGQLVSVAGGLARDPEDPPGSNACSTPLPA
jgi:hypothetical protein